MVLKLFFILFVLHIPNKSWANIPGSEYFDTKNVSLIKASVRVCCHRNELLDDGECSEKAKSKVVGARPYVKMSLKNGTIITLYLNKDVIVQRYWFEYCDAFYDLTEDELLLFENGNLGIQFESWTMSTDTFCLYVNLFSSDISKNIFLVDRRPCEYQKRQKVDQEINVVAISLICNALTIAVYVFIHKKRNIIGKCFICYIVSFSIHHLMWILTKYGSPINDMCTTAGYARYFFAMCCILWLFVISHKLRIGLLAINQSNEPRYLLARYSAFVCGLAGVATAVIFLIDRNWLGDLSTSQWTPSIGIFQCWFNPNAWSILIYFIGPILVLTIANWIMFALTAIQVIKVQRNAEQLILSSHNSNRYSYLRLVRICVMMGTSWVLDLIPYFYRGNVFWQWFFWLAYYYHLALGVVIFVLFVLKRSTIKLISERIRCRKRDLIIKC